MFTLAIVGRPNVGKSTLFNRLAGKKLALVDDRPGVTRDWRRAPAQLYDRYFEVIDTAGLEERFDDSIEARMRTQTERALEHANAIVFVVDGRAGITPMDQHFAAFLRRRKIPVILAVNKAETTRAVQGAMAEAYGLGLGEPIAISAEHGEGMEDLYHALIPHMPDDPLNVADDTPREDADWEALDDLEGREDYEFSQDEEPAENPLKIAIVGRPNVGKSTLMNAILKEPRVMTGPEAGITRDAIAVDWAYEGRMLRLVDTAGIRKKAKVQDAVEKMSVEDSLRAIRLAQVVILVIDATAPLERQDVQLAGHILDEGRALIVAVNKWDLVKNKQEVREDLAYTLERSIAQSKNIRFVTLSALNGANIAHLLEAVPEIYALWNKRIKTAGLNRWLGRLESRNPAPLVDGRPNRLKYMTQIKTRPPTFALWVSQPDKLPGSYQRYVINAIRTDYDLPAVPIRLVLRRSKNPFV